MCGQRVSSHARATRAGVDSRRWAAATRAGISASRAAPCLPAGGAVGEEGESAFGAVGELVRVNDSTALRCAMKVSLTRASLR
jgi:hypothetical protein